MKLVRVRYFVKCKASALKNLYGSGGCVVQCKFIFCQPCDDACFAGFLKPNKEYIFTGKGVTFFFLLLLLVVDKSQSHIKSSTIYLY